jgi:glycosyltransferase involved in cell wall biosynthesis
MTMQNESTIVKLRISVAMCVCNGARFLAEQLQSIALQTILPQELVICDDASTDESIAVIEEFGKRAPFQVRLYQNQHRLGPAKNFERAIGLCEGEYIFLCDQDDVWKATKVERMAAALQANPDAAYAFSDAEMVDENGSPLGQTLWDAVGLRDKINRFSGTGQLAELLKHNIVTGATMAFRSSFRDAALPIAEGWMHDYWLVLLASAVSFGVPVPEPLLSYRRHASQVCGWRKKTFWQVCLESLQARAEDWTQKVQTYHRLLERVDSISSCYRPSPPDRRKLLREKEQHLNSRSSTRGSNGLVRIARVLTEASTGRYQRFSDSWFSIVRDL